MEEKENKKSKGFNWQGIIIGLVIGIALSVAFTKGMYDGYYSKTGVSDKKSSNSKNENYTQKSESLDVVSDIVQNNLEKFNNAAGYYGGALKEYLKEEKITSKDIDNNLAFATIAASGLMKEEEITEEEFESYIKQYYGEDYKYTHEEKSGKICASIHYDSTDKKYKKGSLGGCGGTAGPNTLMYTVSQANLIDDELVLTIKVLFPGNYDDKNENGYVNYYSDAKHEKVIKDLEYDATYGTPHRTQKLFQKGGTYKFVMKKIKGDTYSFVSSEPINN